VHGSTPLHQATRTARPAPFNAVSSLVAYLDARQPDTRRDEGRRGLAGSANPGSPPVRAGVPSVPPPVECPDRQTRPGRRRADEPGTGVRAGAAGGGRPARARRWMPWRQGRPRRNPHGEGRTHDQAVVARTDRGRRIVMAPERRPAPVPPAQTGTGVAWGRAASGRGRRGAMRVSTRGGWTDSQAATASAWSSAYPISSVPARSISFANGSMSKSMVEPSGSRNLLREVDAGAPRRGSRSRLEQPLVGRRVDDDRRHPVLQGVAL
jgi:hypothetical protein